MRRRFWLHLCSATVFLGLLIEAHARPSYMQRIPVNGVGCETCHSSPYGGRSRNQFGQDFRLQGLNWTVALCIIDSDGDGFTNGEELGFSCCAVNAEGAFVSNSGGVWTRGCRELPIGQTFPGDATSTPLGDVQCLPETVDYTGTETCLLERSSDDEVDPSSEDETDLMGDNETIPSLETLELPETGCLPDDFEFGPQRIDECVRVRALNVSVGNPMPGAIAAPFTVNDCDGNPVVGLDDEDFVIFDDGDSNDVESSKLVLDRRGTAFVTMVLDDSASLRSANAVDAVADAAKAYVDSALECGGSVYIAIATFSRRFVVIREHTNDANILYRSIESYRNGSFDTGTTNLFGSYLDALNFSSSAQQSYQNQQRQGVVTFGQVFLFTDGDDNAELSTLQDAAAALEQSPDDVFIVGLGNVDADTIRTLSAGRSSLATNASELRRLFRNEVARLQRRQQSVYSLGYCSTRLANSHRVEISIANGPRTELLQYSAQGWSDYNGPPCNLVAFNEACDNASCGGLWCGACGGPNDGAVCEVDLTCSDGSPSQDSTTVSSGDVPAADGMSQADAAGSDREMGDGSGGVDDESDADDGALDDMFDNSAHNAGDNANSGAGGERTQASMAGDESSQNENANDERTQNTDRGTAGSAQDNNRPVPPEIEAPAGLDSSEDFPAGAGDDNTVDAPLDASAASEGGCRAVLGTRPLPPVGLLSLVFVILCARTRRLTDAVE